MSDAKKDDAPDELNDEQLSDVGGGAGLAVSTPVSVQPGPPDVMAPLPVISTGEHGTGMASGKRRHGELVIKKDPDPTMA